MFLFCGSSIAALDRGRHRIFGNSIGRRVWLSYVAKCLGAVPHTSRCYCPNRDSLFRQPIGFAFAFANCALFGFYIILGHRIANSIGASDNAGLKSVNAIDQLAGAMLVAMVVITPFGLHGALPTFSNPLLLAAGFLVGVCSSVIPYVTDQPAMARLHRATFALKLSLLPVFATFIGAVVLHQIPTFQDIFGIMLVATGIGIHRQEGK